MTKDTSHLGDWGESVGRPANVCPRIAFAPGSQVVLCGKRKELRLDALGSPLGPNGLQSAAHKCCKLWLAINRTQRKIGYSAP